MGDSLTEFARRTSASTTNYIQTTKKLQAEADRINAGDYSQRAECERFMKFANALLKSKPFQNAVRAEITREIEKYRGSKAELKHPEAEVSKTPKTEEQNCRYRLDARIEVRIGEFSFQGTNTDGDSGTFSGEVLNFSRHFGLRDTANCDTLIQEFVTGLRSSMKPQAFLDTVMPVLEKFAGQKRRAPDRKGQPEVK